VIDKEGKIRLELRAPFSYLKDISDQVQTSSMVNGVKDSRKKKTGILNVAGFSEAECSNQLLCCGEDRSLSEPFSQVNPADFLRQIAFPQRASIARFTNPEKLWAVR
jgi:hypothetical protein